MADLQIAPYLINADGTRSGSSCGGINVNSFYLFIFLILLRHVEAHRSFVFPHGEDTVIFGRGPLLAPSTTLTERNKIRSWIRNLLIHIPIAGFHANAIPHQRTLIFLIFFI